MFSLQKSTSDRTDLGYDISSLSIASISATVFFFFFLFPHLVIMLKQKTIMSKLILASENIDNGKSILGTPPKQDKKEVKNPRAKKANS